MKNVALAILSLLSINLIGQTEYNHVYSYSSSSYNPIQYSPPENVQQITFVKTNLKNKKTKTFSKKYNESGQLVAFNFINKDNQNQPIAHIKYDEYGKEISSKSFKHGKLKNTISYVRTAKGARLSQIKTNARNKKVIYNTWKYNDDDNLSESVRYKKGGTKLYRKWTYAYYDKSNKSKSTLYNSKGKVINVWTFDCKQEGEKLEKKKNQTQVCKWEESTQKFLIKTYQSFNEKGEVIKSVTTYTLKDTLIVEHKIYDKNDLLTSRATYDKSFKKPLIRETYRKGKMRWGYEYKYENELKVYQSFSFNGKMRSRAEFLYNKEGLLIEQKNYNRKNNLYSSVTLDYVM